MEDACYITLRCLKCEDYNCKYCPLGTYVPYESKRGCVRKVDEETAARFIHYMYEEIPFWHTQPKIYVEESYKEIMNFLFKNIYSSKIVHLLDKTGKCNDKKLHIDK